MVPLLESEAIFFLNNIFSGSKWSYISRIWEIQVFPIRLSDIPTIMIFPTIPIDLFPVILIFLTCQVRTFKNLSQKYKVALDR